MKKHSLKKATSNLLANLSEAMTTDKLKEFRDSFKGKVLDSP
jgi:hypothetical protein